MTESRRLAINNFANDLREEYTLNTPISMEDLVSLVTNFGGTYLREDLSLDTDGYIQKTGETSFSIVLNSAQNAIDEREKFTLAHEIGHLYIHMGFENPNVWNEVEAQRYIDSTYNRAGNNSEENDANEFAGALLMPKAEYLATLRNTMDSNNNCDINAIAEYFNVSFQAALTRGRWLGFIQW